MEKLLYILDHRYSEANLTYERLKGRDVFIGRLLKESCAEQGFVFLLANVTKTIFNAESEYEEDHEWDLALTNLVKLDGREFLSKVDMVEDEIVQDSPFDRYPDEETSEETGNEGVDATHFYHNSVSLNVMFHRCII